MEKVQMIHKGQLTMKMKRFQGIEVKWIQLEHQKERARRIQSRDNRSNGNCKDSNKEIIGNSIVSSKEPRCVMKRVGARPGNWLEFRVSTTKSRPTWMSSKWSNTSQAMTH
jgi:hypothetical protein